MPYKPIEDYGIIGDLHSVALVGTDGSIDFLCLPRFDSPSVFAALLDDERGGRFQIRPVCDGARERQLYLPDSNVLLSRFLFSSGVAEVSDLMVRRDSMRRQALVRRAKTVRGEVSFRMRCAPRFDYGRAPHSVERRGNEVVFRADGLALRLSASVPIRVECGDAVAEFTLGAGEHASFVLERAQEGQAGAAEEEHFAEDAFKETINFWRRWIGRCTYRGRWQETVHRSALTLKLLTSCEFGSLVAAPTFGLPERVGGARNWDYRYTWIRDASFTLYALMRLGFTQEAAAFMRWIEQRCDELEPDGALQILYGIDGRHEIGEEELSHFEGYRGSSPVRIGNAAHDQLQLDIYGELMDAVYLHDKHGEPIHYGLWQNLVRLVDWVCRHWQTPDESIWEIRSGRREFLYSRLMCWVAVDRAIRLANKRSLPAPFDRWHAVRDEIYRQIHTDFWDAARGVFRQQKGSDTLDASSLVMPLVRFVSPTDPKWLSALRGLEEHLVEDSLVYRYRNRDAAHDGLRGGEGTFSMCTFWYVECLSRAGDLRKARFFFEKMLGYANHLGLFGEELGPTGEHLGNFPQAFTHLALISAAYDLDRRLGEAVRQGHADCA
jgi:GH15 family glucan-1,4-alpha-glucosidase